MEIADTPTKATSQPFDLAIIVFAIDFHIFSFC